MWVKNQSGTVPASPSPPPHDHTIRTDRCTGRTGWDAQCVWGGGGSAPRCRQTMTAYNHSTVRLQKAHHAVLYRPASDTFRHTAAPRDRFGTGGRQRDETGTHAAPASTRKSIAKERDLAQFDIFRQANRKQASTAFWSLKPSLNI